jgi:hypothetical protein
MKLNRNTWHYRWYAYWLANGRGTAPAYQENLCHYMQVLFFWAPATWIDQHTSWDWGVVFPVVFLGGAALYLLGFGVYLLVLVAMAHLTAFLAGIGTFAGSMASIGLLVLIVRTLQGKHLEIPGTIKLVGSYAIAKKRRICPFIEFEG